MKKVLTVLLALFVAVAFAGVTVAADNAAKAAPAKKAEGKGDTKAPASDNAAKKTEKKAEKKEKKAKKAEKKAPAADNAAKAPAKAEPKPAEKK
jgi:uncharacterized protein YxeA